MCFISDVKRASSRTRTNGVMSSVSLSPTFKDSTVVLKSPGSTASSNEIQRQKVNWEQP